MKPFVPGEELREKLAADFEALLDLRYRLHLRMGAEHDEVTSKDPEWAHFQKIASRLDENLPAFNEFLRGL